MRLFRKSKAAPEPEIHVAVLESTADHARPPSPPPPALQLNFELPPLPSSTLDLGDSPAVANEDSQPLAQPHAMLTEHRPEPAPPPKQTTLFEQIAEKQESSYAFDYPVHIDDAAPRKHEDTVRSQLMEQYGHKLSSAQASSSTTRPQAQQAQAMHQQIEQLLQTSSRARPSVQQPNGSPSSCENGSSSSEDDGVQKLNSSMAAMSLVGSNASEGMKMSERALCIQRMREASAMGKMTAFNKAAVEEADIDDENDLVPLGGLRQMKINTAPNSVLGTPNTVSGPAFPQQQQQQPPSIAHGAMMQSPAGHAMAMFAQTSQNPRQAAYHHQQPGAMPSPLSASAKPYAMIPLTGGKNDTPRSVSYSNTNPGMSMQSLPMGQALQPSPLQQMAYPRVAGGSQPMQAAGMFRSPMSGNASITFGSVGLSRGAAAQDPAKFMYAPSPLGQMSPYYQPGMNAHPAMAGYMPTVAANSSHPLVQQQQQQQQQIGMMGGQQGALMNFIPTANHCSRSMSKNPLMRDLNKVKEFSARDYTSRPTLLAEADSRRMAKKNMPGLGGTTCHSFQPQPPPAIQQQQQQPPPPEAYPPSPLYGHDYHGHPREHHYGNRPDAAYRRPSHRRNEPGHGYVSSSSSTSNKRRSTARDNRGRTTKRRQRYEDSSYSRFDERPPAREFRQREPLRRSRGRGPPNRGHHHRHDDRDYDHYDYDDYSDSYASEYYDEWEGEYDDYYDGRGGERLLHRRSAHRRSRGAHSRAASGLDERWRKHPSRRDGPGDYRHKHHPAHLDDPRDNNSVVRAATRRMGPPGTADVDTAGGLPGVRPRSQFGRMLANIKRHATTSKAPSPVEPTQESPCLASAEPEADSSACGELVTAEDVAEDAGIGDPQPVADASSVASDVSLANSACPTPAAPAAAVIAAN